MARDFVTGLLPDGPASVGQEPSACDPSRTELDWFNECAREIGKLPDEWQWFKLEVIGRHPNTQGVMVTGAIPQSFFTRGPRKGEPKWSDRDRKSDRQVFVSHEAIDARQARYEAETMRCFECQGEGRVVWSICIEKGVGYRACRRCKGAGIAPAFAQGTEARSAETERLGPKDDGPSAESGAPDSIRSHP